MHIDIDIDIEIRYVYSVAAPLPRAKPRTAYGMRAHGAASAAGLRSAMKLRL